MSERKCWMRGMGKPNRDCYVCNEISWFSGIYGDEQTGDCGRVGPAKK